jgi:hypothetical protein
MIVIEIRTEIKPCFDILVDLAGVHVPWNVIIGANGRPSGELTHFTFIQYMISQFMHSLTSKNIII